MTITLRGPLWAPLLIVAVCCAVYLRTLFAGFVSDDLAMVVDNAANLGDPAMITRYFSAGVWNHANAPSADASLYRPAWLTWMMINYQFAGESAMVWHLSNLLLHAANVLLFYLLLSTALPGLAPVARILGTLLFGVHPATAQSVAWIAGSTDLLMTFGVLAALWGFLRYLQSGRHLFYPLVLCAAALAMFSKETGLVVLPLLLVLERVHAGRWARVCWWRHLGLLGVLVLYLWARTAALGGVLDAAEAPWAWDMAALERLFDYAAKYFAMLLVPWPLPFTFGHPAEGIAEPWDYVAALLLLGLLLAAMRHGFAAWLPVALVVLPVAFPLLAAFHAKGAFAARFLYLPAAGLAWVLLLLAGHYLQRRAWRYAGIGLLASSAVVSFLHAGDWRDEYHWAGLVARSDPGAAQGWTVQGRILEEAGRVEEALARYRAGMALVSDAAGRAAITERLALLLADRRRFSESLEVYAQLAAMPGFAAVGWTGVGNNRWVLGDQPAAIEAYGAALAADGSHFEARYNLGYLHELRGETALALRAYRQLLELRPGPGQAQALVRARAFVARHATR